jgi:hypothetical protein
VFFIRISTKKDNDVIIKINKNLQNWKKIFLENAEIAMEPAKAVKEYKEELSAAQEQNEMLTKC